MKAILALTVIFLHNVHNPPHRQPPPMMGSDVNIFCVPSPIQVGDGSRFNKAAPNLMWRVSNGNLWAYTLYPYDNSFDSASFYASATGVGDPVSNPGGWTFMTTVAGPATEYAGAWYNFTLSGNYVAVSAVRDGVTTDFAFTTANSASAGDYWAMTDAPGNPRIDTLNGNNLAETGGIVLTMNGPSDNPLANGAAVMATGTSGYLLNSALANMITSGDCAYAFWFYLSALPTGNKVVTQIVNAANTADVFKCYVANSAGLAKMYAGTDFKMTGVNVSIGVWHHVVLSQSAGSGMVSLYLDGALVDNTIPNSGVTAVKMSVLDQITGGAQLNGAVCQAAWWNHALELADVIALYKNGSGNALSNYTK